jgi:hypothetical protein
MYFRRGEIEDEDDDEGRGRFSGVDQGEPADRSNSGATFVTENLKFWTFMNRFGEGKL